MKTVNISKPAYAMTSADGKSAEVVMYGEVVETHPVDWWTGEAVPGEFICMDEFLEDLNELKFCSNITIRLNTVGGDATVGIVIHNRLRELSRAGTEITCIVDGLAASAGSFIMCAGDRVRVNPSSMVMVHHCSSVLFGMYNARELEDVLAGVRAHDDAGVSIYQRKTGLSDAELRGLMDESTYLTGRDAVDKGFADEIIEDAEPLEIAASADGRSVFVRGHQIRLAAFAPDSIPTINPGAIPAGEIKPAAAAAEDPRGVVKMTLDELKAQYPELVEQVRAEVAATVAADTETAVKAERDRLSAIDEVANLFTAEEVTAAKYGEARLTAEQMVMAAARKSAAQGRNFLHSVESDYQASGAAQVTAAPAPSETTSETLGDVMADARSAAHAYLTQKGGK